MTETQDAGTQPSLVQDPLSSLELQAPRFAFPEGLRGAIDSGPFGPMSGDRPTWEVPSTLGVSLHPGSPRIFSLNVPTTLGVIDYAPVDVNRPTLMLLVGANPPATKGYYKPAYLPQISPAGFDDVLALTGKVTLPAWGPHFWLWAPGRWYISGDYSGNLLAAFQAQYFMLPVEDPRTVEFFLNSETVPPVNGQTNIDVATGGAATVLTLAQMLQYSAVEFQNTGAVNAVRLQFGGSFAPTATSGISLAPGASVLLSGRTMPMAMVRAFSAAASTLRITTWFRWPSNSFL